MFCQILPKIKLNNLIISKAELACKSEADGFTHYVMNTMYCVFALAKLKLNLFKF